MWWLVIIATLSGVLKASIEPALRALIITIPDKSDVGKIFAFVGLLECIWLTIDRSVYTHLYNALILSFPQVRCQRFPFIWLDFNFWIILLPRSIMWLRVSLQSCWSLHWLYWNSTGKNTEKQQDPRTHNWFGIVDTNEERLGESVNRKISQYKFSFSYV
jgi:hypothetical protein